MSETNDAIGDPTEFNRQLIAQFRANGGQIVTGLFKGAPLLLLTTIGAKSGQPRTTPLAYTRDGDRWVIIASKGGAPTNPDWYRNLLAQPTATVEVGTERFPVRAHIAVGAERDRLYDQMAAQLPNYKFAEHQRKTTRKIPVVTLERM
jgi:deazaflavin-dependent oxidoreductase (nitroreductase family)